jgi:hypothetical protein
LSLSGWTLVKHELKVTNINRPQKARLSAGPEIDFQTGKLMNEINKKELSETDICDLFITPAL